MRLVKCNSLDLNLFQFDYDLTFAVFFLNPDGTVYARYGTRTSMESADDDVSLEGLAETMRCVLQLHDNYSDFRRSLSGKQPAASDVEFPEDLTPLKGFQSELDYDGAVTKSCIHCHQVRDAMRQEFRVRGEAIPEKLLFPYPTPASIGLEMDVKTRATISGIDQVAKDAGFEAGDEIVTINGQSICSPADIQWVLHNSHDGDSLRFIVTRKNSQTLELTMTLPEGWRGSSDISWRPTSWDLRRMSTGGMVLNAIDEETRARLEIPDGQMALQVNHVGQYGAHAVAKRAGFRKGDIVVSFDGSDDFVTESLLMEHALNQREMGETVEVEILRSGQRKKLQLKLQ